MKQKTIAVISNEIDWSIKTGYSFANGLYYKLSEKYIINIIVPTVNNAVFFGKTDESVTYLNKNMTVRKVYPGKRHWQEIKDSPDAARLPPFAKIMLYADDDILIRRIIAASGKADIIICNSLFPYNVTYRAFRDKDIILRSLDNTYECFAAHNKHVLASNPDIAEDQKRLMMLMEDDFYIADKLSYNTARYILTLTQGDEDAISGLFHINRKKFIRMPLCYDKADSYDGYIPKKEYDAVKNCVFVSTNTTGAQLVLEGLLSLSGRFSDITFHLIGSCCSSVIADRLPDNCIRHGFLPDKQKEQLLKSSDCAFSAPGQSHGMYAKNWDYILHAIPILSDRLGMRGYNLEGNQDYFILDFNDIYESFRRFIDIPGYLRRDMAISAYDKCLKELRYEKYIPAFEKALGLYEKDDVQNCLIFGAGINGLECYNHHMHGEYRCIGFIDNNSTHYGNKKFGLDIIPPSDISGILSGNSAKIIIAVGANNIKDIYVQLLNIVNSKDIWLYYDGVLLTDDLDWGKVLK